MSEPSLGSKVVSGASWSFLATLCILATFLARRYLMAIGAPLGCAAIMAAVVLAIPDFHAGPLAQLIVLASFCGVTYGLALVIARETVAEILGFLRPLPPYNLKNKLGMA